MAIMTFGRRRISSKDNQVREQKFPSQLSQILLVDYGIFQFRVHGPDPGYLSSYSAVVTHFTV
jgi:hypothetical protein